MSTSHLTKLKRKAAEFEQKKQFDKALSLYIQFVDEAGKDLDDADLQLFNRVGDLLTRQGNPSEALSYYEKAVDMYAERGFLNNAIALCNKVLRQSPARTSVYYKLGKISASKGFRSDARKNFLEYADRMQKAGQREEALRALKEFADLCPDQDDIRLMLAEMLSRDSRSAEAIEQLEQLYLRQEAEGRSAEARATADRIKAIDPEATPRGTGVAPEVRANDLVFLDLGDAGFTAAPRATPERATPVAPAVAVEVVDVSGVAALAGLSITFLPDESEAPPVPSQARLTPISGLEVMEGGTPEADAVGSLPGLDTVPTAAAEEEPPSAVLDVASVLDVEVDAFEAPDDVVPHVDGLASAAVTLTGAHPSLAPLLEFPPMSGAEFGDLTLATNEEEQASQPHDLGLASSLPRLDAPLPDRGGAPALLDETPDEWVQAALDAPRIDTHLEHLLTPLSVQAITGVDAPLDFEVVTPSAGIEEQVAAMLDLSALQPPSLSDPAIDLLASIEGHLERQTPAAVPTLDLGEPEPVVTETAAPAEAEPLSPEFDVPEAFVDALPLDATAGRDAPELSALLDDASDPAGVLAVDMPDGDVLSGDVAEVDRLSEEVPDVDAPIGEVNGAFGEIEAAAMPDDTANLPDAFIAATDAVARDDSAPFQEGALDTATLRAAMDAAADTAADAAEREDAMMRAAFADERVELPLIDLERDASEDEGLSFDTSSGEIDALLAAPPNFDDEPSSFDPAPLGLDTEAEASAEPPPSTEEWTRPEVLIDGEWRDENVGDLVSGEMFVIGERREVLSPEPAAPIFDDLAAAMLYEPQAGRPTPGAQDAYPTRATPRHTLSFGGVEAQLRRRLELNPGDVTLRRQLAEALLDLGDREGGLSELEAVVSHFEALNKLDDAGEVVDVILRVVPLSVRHHQKRVEYAARSGNRGKLVEAYTELGDALFRCGEPDKARVVYTRVVELAPGNERASFALGMLSANPGTLRQSDEIPVIDVGVLGGHPSLTMATLTPESVDEQPSTGSSAPTPSDPLDDEVDAAFESPKVVEQRRRTSELMAVEEWASTAEVASDAVAPAGDEFVNLGDWLRGEGSPRSTRMVAADVAPSGDEAADFAEMLRRFKAGVEENVEAEDYASHYDLGVAYKEMGLVDEAVAQFQRALRGPAHRVRSYEALGQCFVEKGQFEVAIALLQRPAEQPGADEFAMCGVLYLLGYACEQVGRRADAMRYFQRVFAVDIAFRDVATRLAALERTAQ
ncbi:MAG: tetratricopeptide repeat protein [Gemmatimonadetes bacterium]|nr:tetratricopeptide repeat protein [Gemmatimonadota bacterium]